MLLYQTRLIDIRSLELGRLFHFWGRILKFAIPGALGMILTPLSAAVLIRLVADYGNAAVAATGVASRIEMFAFMIAMTVGMSLMPFVAQNYGSGRMDRIRLARRGSMIFALLYGVSIGVLLLIFTRPLAGLFSEEKDVIEVLCTYIRITCMGYGMLEVNRYAGIIMTGVYEPMRSSVLSVIRVLVLLIPLSIAGGTFFKLTGIFWARFVTDILAGLIGIWWSGHILDVKEMPRVPSMSAGNKSRR
jgi:Na+-driven multidrug efflux pump